MKMVDKKSLKTYTKGVIRIHQSTKIRQHNRQRKKGTKVQTTIYKTLHRKLEIEQQNPTENWG